MESDAWREWIRKHGTKKEPTMEMKEGPVTLELVRMRQASIERQVGDLLRTFESELGVKVANVGFSHLTVTPQDGRSYRSPSKDFWLVVQLS